MSQNGSWRSGASRSIHTLAVPRDQCRVNVRALCEAQLMFLPPPPPLSQGFSRDLLIRQMISVVEQSGGSSTQADSRLRSERV